MKKKFPLIYSIITVAFFIGLLTWCGISLAGIRKTETSKALVEFEKSVELIQQGLSQGQTIRENADVLFSKYSNLQTLYVTAADQQLRFWQSRSPIAEASAVEPNDLLRQIREQQAGSAKYFLLTGNLFNSAAGAIDIGMQFDIIPRDQVGIMVKTSILLLLLFSFFTIFAIIIQPGSPKESGNLSLSPDEALRAAQLRTAIRQEPLQVADYLEFSQPLDEQGETPKPKTNSAVSAFQPLGNQATKSSQLKSTADFDILKTNLNTEKTQAPLSATSPNIAKEKNQPPAQAPTKGPSLVREEENSEPEQPTISDFSTWQKKERLDPFLAEQLIEVTKNSQELSIISCYVESQQKLTDNDLFGIFVEHLAPEACLFKDSSDTYAVVLPGYTQENCLQKLRELQTILAKKSLPDTCSLAAGVAARHGRLMTSGQLLKEASHTLDKARKDSPNTILLFRVNLQKYYEILQKRLKKNSADMAFENAIPEP